jgi:hypothetical protein
MLGIVTYKVWRIQFNTGFRIVSLRKVSPLRNRLTTTRSGSTFLNLVRFIAVTVVEGIMWYDLAFTK